MYLLFNLRIIIVSISVSNWLTNKPIHLLILMGTCLSLVAITLECKPVLCVFIGQPGFPGPHGSQGLSGPLGLVGATGASGISGSPGPQGFTGLPGRPGIPGPAGPEGAIGATGEEV